MATDDRSGATMMKRTLTKVLLAVGLVTGVVSAALAGFPTTPVKKCGADAVAVGAVCLDTYEASVWRVPEPTTTNAFLGRKIRQDDATRADLTVGAATQLGTASDDYAPCTDDGLHCANDIYAVSLPSVIPSAHVTWFQAAEACANAGKRLPTSAEWQVGANRTPDPGPDDGTTDCNSDTGSVSLTGARSSCVSGRGAFDMVGNLAELVADWVPISTACSGWGVFSNDFMCLAGAGTTESGPGALLRGGFFFGGPLVSRLTVFGGFEPSRSADFVGFRCAR